MEHKGRERERGFLKVPIYNFVLFFVVCSLLPLFNSLLDKMVGVASPARLAIGQAIAVLFELAREVDSDLLESADSCETYSLIEQLATESNRYTGRKKRNQLRAHFRDVLQTLNVSESGHSDAGGSRWWRGGGRERKGGMDKWKGERDCVCVM